MSLVHIVTARATEWGGVWGVPHGSKLRRTSRALCDRLRLYRARANASTFNAQSKDTQELDHPQTSWLVWRRSEWGGETPGRFGLQLNVLPIFGCILVVSVQCLAVDTLHVLDHKRWAWWWGVALVRGSASPLRHLSNEGLYRRS